MAAVPVASAQAIRSRFPALERKQGDHPVAYFDGPGGTQVPREVVDAMVDYLYHHNANTHWPFPTSRETDAALGLARERFADFFNATRREVAFGNNMTTITFHLARALGRRWGPGDELVVTELDHHANVAPWRALARERGVTIRSVPFDTETGELVWSELERAVSAKTRLVAIGAASNALGTVSPIREAARLAHAQGALCFVDGVHYAPHALIDVKVMECDFFVCSPYKFYGPHAGVLYARAEELSALELPKLEPAPDDIPGRAETGTQNHEGIIGSGAAIEFLASLAPGASRRERLVAALTELHRRGEQLFVRLWERLGAVKGLRRFGPPPGRPRTPTAAFVLENLPASQVATSLAREGLFLSSGNFYAATVTERLGLGPEGLLRAGCACYTTEAEIDRLAEAVQRLARTERGPSHCCPAIRC